MEKDVLELLFHSCPELLCKEFLLSSIQVYSLYLLHLPRILEKRKHLHSNFVFSAFSYQARENFTLYSFLGDPLDYVKTKQGLQQIKKFGFESWYHCYCSYHKTWPNRVTFEEDGLELSDSEALLCNLIMEEKIILPLDELVIKIYPRGRETFYYCMEPYELEWDAGVLSYRPPLSKNKKGLELLWNWDYLIFEEDKDYFSL